MHYVPNPFQRLDGAAIRTLVSCDSVLPQNVPEEGRPTPAEQPVLSLWILAASRLCNLQEVSQDIAGLNSVAYTADSNWLEQAVWTAAQAERPALSSADGSNFLLAARHVLNKETHGAFCSAVLRLG